MLDIFVDADACPVKDEIVRVAERHGLKVHLVSNTWMRGPQSPVVARVVVAEGADSADDWIAEHIGANDIAVTNDIPLAARCLDKDAKALRPDGRPFTEESIGAALAMRDLMAHLRETGDVTGGPSAFGRKDRSNFLNALEAAIQAVRRDNRQR